MLFGRGSEVSDRAALSDVASERRWQDIVARSRRFERGRRSEESVIRAQKRFARTDTAAQHRNDPAANPIAASGSKVFSSVPTRAACVRQDQSPAITATEPDCISNTLSTSSSAIGEEESVGQQYSVRQLIPKLSTCEQRSDHGYAIATDGPYENNCKNGSIYAKENPLRTLGIDARLQCGEQKCRSIRKRLDQLRDESGA